MLNLRTKSSKIFDTAWSIFEQCFLEISYNIQSQKSNVKILKRHFKKQNPIQTLRSFILKRRDFRQKP